MIFNHHLSLSSCATSISGTCGGNFLRPKAYSLFLQPSVPGLNHLSLRRCPVAQTTNQHQYPIGLCYLNLNHLYFQINKHAFKERDNTDAEAFSVSVSCIFPTGLHHVVCTRWWATNRWKSFIQAGHVADHAGLYKQEHFFSPGDTQPKIRNKRINSVRNGSLFTSLNAGAKQSKR